MSDPEADPARRPRPARLGGGSPVPSTAEFIAETQARHRDQTYLTALEDAFAKLGGASGPNNIARLPASDHDPHCLYRVVGESGAVLAFHPCYLELTMQTNLFTSSFEIHGHAGIDHLWQMLLHYTRAWTYNPILVVLPSVNPLPDDAYDNQLRLDIDPDAGVGAIACNISRSHPDGGDLWFTRGQPNTAPAAHRLVTHYHNGDESAFPADAAVPLDVLRRAIHQFYDLNGADLPPCVDWQPSPEVRW
jgi:hypothetical protein